jgi:hypothetical protein
VNCNDVIYEEGGAAVISDEVASALAKFFDRIGPSHDEVTAAFRQAGLDRFDPEQHFGVVGKMKRVRTVLWEGADAEPVAAGELVKRLVALVRANGGFRPSSDSYPGDDAVLALRAAFRAIGYDLDVDGHLRSTLLENLDGNELTEALWVYVRRARSNADDAEEVVGTSKDLMEAAARHALMSLTGGYPSSANFPMTLFQAFDRLGLATPHMEVLRSLDGDEWQAVQKALYLLGVAVNRFRNSDGQGHGRPNRSRAERTHAQVASQAAALVTELLLRGLEDRASAGKSAA